MLQCRIKPLVSLLLAAAACLPMPTHAQDNAPDADHGPHKAALKNADGSWKYTNALIDETSPYLLQHAHNPVDWLPWGEAAFELARKQQKPIFLSIGYSTCYWCHVMERQVFENPELAELLNERFVCIKVDREERPDVDSVYMTATQVMTRGGGWPLNVFLTPPAPEGEEGEAGYGLKPYYCTTYIPPTTLEGHPGFDRVVPAMANAWQAQRPAVLEQAQRLADAVKAVMADADGAGPVDREQLLLTSATLQKLYDPEHAGFGPAPKFPQPANLALLLKLHPGEGDPAQAQALHTLDRMARGGMFDQVGGGFHRYSVDERWLVPHFEKMLYDNGQLLSIYADALALLREQGKGDSDQAVQFERVLRETADYLIREMTDPTGAFWSAQDAEVNAREGENYLWTREQLEATIPDKDLTAIAVKLYGLDGGPNFQDPHDADAKPTNVLYLPKPISELAEELGMTSEQLLGARDLINDVLLAERMKRDQPGTDDKVLVSWNGLAIKGLAEAGAVLDEPRYLAAARRAADAILEHMSTDDGGLYRTMRKGEARVPAFLEDYTHFTAGLIALARRDNDNAQPYLPAARRLTRQAIGRFSARGGGYFDTPPGETDLFVRVRSAYDGAVPTGNSVMTQNLVDLYALTGEEDWLDRAVTDMRSFSKQLSDGSGGLIFMQAAVHDALAIDAAADRLAEAAADQAPAAPTPVRVAAAWTGDDTLTVTLSIDPGVHLNAHEVSNELLTATELELIGPGQLDAEYPDGENQVFPYSDLPIRVYEGELTITAKLTGLGDDSSLRLHYQACTDTHCLAAAWVKVAIPAR